MAFISVIISMMAVIPAMGAANASGRYTFSDISHLFDPPAQAHHGTPSEVYFQGNRGVTVVDGGEARIFEFLPLKVGEYLKRIGITLSEHDRLNLDKEAMLREGLEIRIDRIAYEYEKRRAEIPYHTFETPIGTIPKGTQNLISCGSNGEAENTIRVLYVNGIRTDEFIIDTEVITPAQDEVYETGVGGAVTGSDGTVYSYSYYIDVSATAYCYIPGLTGTTTATGAKLSKGIVAVDKNVIPFHTEMYITGDVEYGYGIAEDTGGAIKGNKIDVAFESYEECVSFGRRNMRVYILE